MGVAKDLRVLIVHVIQGLSILTASLVLLLLQQIDDASSGKGLGLLLKTSTISDGKTLLELLSSKKFV